MRCKIFSKFFSVILAAVISVTLFTVAFAANSGDCGADVNWSFDEATGELTISGNDTMTDYDKAEDTPWYSFADKISKITVSDGVTSIGRYAFNGFKSLTEISLPDGLKTIGYGAFDSCTSLRSITIPSSVKKLNASPFFNCTALEAITVEDGNKYYSSDNDGVLYNADKTELVQYPCGRKFANFIVPFTVTSINQGAFAGAEKLLNVVISEPTETIDSMAFYGCTALKTVTIPKSVEMIGEKAFSKCDSLAEIYYTGTQEEWNAISLGNDNESISVATFKYETKGPDAVPENIQSEPQQTTTTSPAETESIITREDVVEKREIIPIILIGIAAVILVLIIILIRVIVKKKPDTE